MKKLDKWEVDEEQFKNFYGKLWQMTREEFGVDCDDMCPVQIILVNKVMHKKLHFFPSPRTDLGCKEIKKYNEEAEIDLLNLKLAFDEFYKTNKIRNNMATELQDKKKKL